MAMEASRVSAQYSAIMAPRGLRHRRAAAIAASAAPGTRRSLRVARKVKCAVPAHAMSQQRQKQDGAPFRHKITAKNMFQPRHERGIASPLPDGQRLTVLAGFFPAVFFDRRLIGGIAASWAARPVSISFSTILVSADSRASTKGNLR